MLSDRPRGDNSKTYIAVDPLEPVLSAMAGAEVLQIVNDRNTLGFGGAQEVVLDRICAATRSMGGLLTSYETY
jgi:hypothetical protein